MIRSYIAIDLETTGLNPKKDRIIEIGALRIVDGKEEGEFSSLINPYADLPDSVRELTGISAAMLEAAPGMEEIAESIKTFCQGLPLLGHRVIFDYSFLKRALINWGGEKDWEKDGIDTLVLCRRFMPPQEKKNLSAACGYFAIENGKAHRAVSDARAAHNLYQALWEAYGRQDPKAFAPKPLTYRIKKEQPATKRQKERLHDLIKYHKIDISVQIEHLTRNEASRLTDQILSRYGKI